MADTGWRKMARGGMWAGGAWTVVKVIWERIGDVGNLQTIADLVRNRRLVTGWMSAVLSSGWTGPAITAISVAVYWALRKADRSGVKADPVIELSATGGKNAVITVANKGGAFRLVARARITNASLPISNAAHYTFVPREVAGGNDVSSYTIATLNETSPPGVSVKVRGEGMSEIQYWHQKEGHISDFWFETKWTLLKQSGDDQVALAEALVRVTFDAAKLQLKSSMGDASTNAGVLTVNTGGFRH